MSRPKKTIKKYKTEEGNFEIIMKEPLESKYRTKIINKLNENENEKDENIM